MSQLDTSAAQAPLGNAKSTGDAIANARWFEWLARAGLVARGAIYGIIGVLALEMAFGAGGKTTNQSGALGELAKQPGGKILLLGSGGGSSSPDKATGGVLGWPGGQLIVAIAGLVLIGVGLYQGYEGVKKKFLEKSKTGEMSERTKQVFTALGTAGHLARMVIFALIGYFLFKAAIDYDPGKAVSVDGALAFGAYSIADARYRRV